jgi:hypothetical protein
MDCKKLWEMPDEEFEKLFLKEGKWIEKKDWYYKIKKQYYLL